MSMTGHLLLPFSSTIYLLYFLDMNNKEEIFAIPILQWLCSEPLSTRVSVISHLDVRVRVAEHVSLRFFSREENVLLWSFALPRATSFIPSSTNDKTSDVAVEACGGLLTRCQKTYKFEKGNNVCRVERGNLIAVHTNF